MFEQNLRQGLIIGFGNPLVFLTSPISAGFIGLAGIVTLAPLLLARWRPRELSVTPPEASGITDSDR
jgi:TctA family transporter